MNSNHGIVFYDGACGFCLFWVRFIIDRDRHHFFKFCSLQGPTALALGFGSNDPAKLNTMYYQESGVLYQKSSAWLKIAARLNGGWWLITGFKAVPRVVRDFVYDRIALNRYRFQGLARYCQLPSEQERTRFID